MRTEQEYAAGTAALTAVVQAAVKAAGIPAWEIPTGFLEHLEVNGARAAIDAADAEKPHIG